MERFMRAVRVDGQNEVSLVTVPMPVLRQGWVLVRVAVCAICATDLDIISGNIDARYPVIPGHEWAGVVEKASNFEDELWLGKRVTGDNEVTCLKCEYCRTGRWRQCPSYQQIGFGEYGGGYAEYMTVPSYALHEVPADVSFAQAALAEPIGVALAVMKESGLSIGDTLTVIGDGSIGLHCLLVGRAAGARDIVLSGTEETRLSVGRAFGAARIVKRDVESVVDVVRDLHGNSDVVVEASGAPEAVHSALRILKPGGTLVLAGYAKNLPNSIIQDMIHTNNIKVVGAGNNPGWISRALSCLGSGMLKSEQMLTHTFSLDEYGYALRQVATKEDGLVKSAFVMGTS